MISVDFIIIFIRTELRRLVLDLTSVSYIALLYCIVNIVNDILNFYINYILLVFNVNVKI